MDIYLKLRIGLNFFEALAVGASLMYWKKLRHSYWRFFAFYLATIFLAEVTGEFTGYQLHWVRFNIALYRYFVIPLEFLFFFWLFWKYFGRSLRRWWAFAAAFLYLICLAVDLAWLGGLETAFFSFSYMAGNMSLLVLVILFLSDFIRSDEILNYRSSMMFWVSAGLLVFFMLSLPLYGLWNTLAYRHPGLFNRYWIATMVFNYIMYLLFALSFVWGKPR